MKKNYNNSNSDIASRIIRDGGGVTSARHLTGCVRFAHTAPYRKCGFTLAEVLITLAIVGVVAVLTLPNLIADYQKKQTVTKLKRVYTTFANAFEMAKVDHGDYGDWEWEHIPTDAGARSQYFMNTYVFPYLSVVKTCIPSTTKECFAENSTLLNGTVNTGIYGEKHVGFILKDGTTVEAWAGGDSYLPHALFFVDINGFKKPNKVGRDIFTLRFSNNIGSYACGDVDENNELINEKVCVEPRGLSFEGIGYGSSVQDYLNPNFVLVSGPSNNKNKTSCTKNGNGRLCGAAIYINNWEIPEGYPW